MNGASNMTKELAILLLTSKDVYLTPKGKELLKLLADKENLYNKN